MWYVCVCVGVYDVSCDGCVYVKCISLLYVRCVLCVYVSCGVVLLVVFVSEVMPIIVYVRTCVYVCLY